MFSIFRKSDIIRKSLKQFKQNFDKEGIRVDYVLNGNMLLGVNRQEDVSNLLNTINVQHKNGVFVMIFFNNSKPDNDKRLSNFKESDTFKEFKKYDINSNLVYTFSHSSVNIDYLETVIKKLLFDVYEIDNKTEIEYFVRVVPVVN